MPARQDRQDKGRLDRILAGQDRVLTREQALDCGYASSSIRYRTRVSKVWQPLLPGVILTVSGMATTRQRAVAALLYAGEGGILTGVEALRAHGLRYLPQTDKVDVLIPHERLRQSFGYARLQRTTRLPQPVVIDLLPCAPVARAVADCVRRLNDLRTARAVVADAVQRGRCTAQELIEELAAGPIRYSALLRDVLAEIKAGIRSSAEGMFLDLVRRGGLPLPMLNQDLYAENGRWLARPDAWWPEAGMAVEIDSREWHLSPREWQRTMRRHARMSAAGILVLHFSPNQVRDHPEDVLAVIRQALRTGAERGAAAVRTSNAS